jgi:seryl-tRNA synthetase
MLDIRLIREQPDTIKARLAARGGDAHLHIDEILACDKERRAAETQLQQLQSDRKRISKEIGIRKSKGEDTSSVEAEVRVLGDEVAKLNDLSAALDNRQRELLLNLPNVPHENCPVGADAEANPEVRVWGEKPVFAFTPKSHVELGEALGLFDFDRAAKISGSAFVCFTGAGARLERALLNFLLDLHTTQHGYREVSTPFIIRPEALVGTSQLPKFEEQLYRCDRDELYLAPTAEVPVTNLHREEILSLEQLPREVEGAAGTAETHGYSSSG